MSYIYQSTLCVLLCVKIQQIRIVFFVYRAGGGPKVVVITAAFHARVRGSFPGPGGLKETKLFFLHPLVKHSIVWSLRDWEVAY